MVGVVMPSARVAVPLGRITPGRPLVWRIAVTWTGDRGLSTVRSTDAYVYVTPDPVDRDPHPDANEVLRLRERLGSGAVVDICPQH